MATNWESRVFNTSIEVCGNLTPFLAIGMETNRKHMETDTKPNELYRQALHFSRSINVHADLDVFAIGLGTNRAMELIRK